MSFGSLRSLILGDEEGSKGHSDDLVLLQRPFDLKLMAQESVQDGRWAQGAKHRGAPGGG